MRSVLIERFARFCYACGMRAADDRNAFSLWRIGFCAALGLLLCATNGFAKEPFRAVTIYRLSPEQSDRPLAAGLAPPRQEVQLGDLAAAEKFFAAPVKSDLLLATYDCVAPIGDFLFFSVVDEKLTPLKLWAADPWMNLAILKAEGASFSPLSLGGAAMPGPAAELVLGSTGEKLVVAASNRKSASPTESARARAQSLYDFGGLLAVKSSTPLPPGAPLLSSDGSLQAIALGSEAPDRGSLCAPVDAYSAQAIQSLIRGEPRAYGFLGLEPGNISDLPEGRSHTGVYVRQVMPHSPAQAAGLREENPRTGEIDQIVQINGAVVETSEELLFVVGRQPFGAKVKITLRRGKLGGATRTFDAEATLAKRYWPPARPPFGQTPPRSWRGIRVDHYTAIDEYAARARLVDPEGCVAIVDVAPDSTAWKAGLRPGMFLSKIDDARIKSEADFERVAAEKNGPRKIATTSKPDGVRLEEQTYEIAP